MTGGAIGPIATPGEVGFEEDPDRPVRKNVERALSALTGHVDDITTEQAAGFVFRHVTGAGPTVARRVLQEGSVDIGSDPRVDAAAFMGG